MIDRSPNDDSKCWVHSGPKRPSYRGGSFARCLSTSNYGTRQLWTICPSHFSYFLVSRVHRSGFGPSDGTICPPLILQGQKAKLQKLFGNFLIVSWVTGTISGCLYLLFTGLWLREFHLLLLIIPAATILVRASTHPFYNLFLGLNQAARWGMSEIFRHWFLLVLVIGGFYIGGLPGALLGLFLTELVVLSIGVWWGKSYCSRAEIRLDIPYLIPYLRFGFIFFIFRHLLTSAFQNSGVVLIRFFYTDYVQVSYFGLANNIHFGISFAIPQFALAFAPLMVTLQTQGETKALTQWIEHLISWLTVGGFFIVFGVLLLGNDLVPLILGAAYQPVATNLLPLSIALWLQVLKQCRLYPHHCLQPSWGSLNGVWNKARRFLVSRSPACSQMGKPGRMFCFPGSNPYSMQVF